MQSWQVVRGDAVVSEFVQLGRRCRIRRQATFVAGRPEARRCKGLPERVIVLDSRIEFVYILWVGWSEEELHLPAFEQEDDAIRKARRWTAGRIPKCPHKTGLRKTESQLLGLQPSCPHS